MKWIVVGLMVLIPVMAQAEVCIASVYSTRDKNQSGTRTSSGIPLNDAKLTMAHRTYRMRGFMKITNLKTGAVTRLQVIDRGPFKIGRCADLSVAAGRAIGLAGLGKVKVEGDD